MKIRSIISSIIFLVILTAGTAFAQTPSGLTKEMRKAVAEYNSLRYLSAIQHLNVVLAKDSANVKAQEMLAFSYKQVKNYDEALFWYEKLSRQKELKSEWVLYYAEALANKQRYERSEQWYRRYLSLMPADKRASAFARANVKDFTRNNGLWKIAYANINSAASEYAPLYFRGGLLFASNRLKGGVNSMVFPWDNTPYTNLYWVERLQDVKDVNIDSALAIAAKGGKGNYKFNHDDTAPTSNDSKTLGEYNPSIFFDTLGLVLNAGKIGKPLKGRVNSRYHEGPSAAFPDGSLMFTRNNFYRGRSGKSKDGVNKLKLFTASGAHLKRINPFPYNSDEYSVGHPALSKDGNILIFASDMPGGFGGTDLYYCVRSGGTSWTRPVNLGKQINTEGNEQFPFLTKDGTLYFASTGHAGLGGLDIFEVALKEMKPMFAPRNVGVPVNSSSDDFGLVMNDDGKNGFFSSNRRGGDDIYHISQAMNRVILEGTIRDARTKLPLPGSRLLLRHLDGTDTLRVNSKGEFRRDLARETDYEITGQKLGYVSQLSFVTSVGITKDSVIRADIYLNKTESPQQYVISHCDSLKRVFAVQSIYYDLDRSEIRPDAKPALDELATLMKKYPEITVITSSHCDSRASDDYNRGLSLRRGASAKAYLASRGISPSRIKVEYYGKTRLVNRCFDGVPCSEADQQLNRRTEFDVILNGVNLTQLDCNER
ncbi:OmpA family protein [Pararcticibacter amylolyticus]|uniref:Flagellar motor protein MotB n=1 Tax=Pararcticibacter amylolyticus TaxID=2173175 RepID=A0A2U2PL85_9SPHI|nr:OmpA family protein [Pararcticibacter amylolyticus]PWG82167.1 flagellar motor protein MotB [Pararcticibacter amylolyticus]